jgi:hypothetical protein
LSHRLVGRTVFGVGIGLREKNDARKYHRQPATVPQDVSSLLDNEPDCFRLLN